MCHSFEDLERDTAAPDMRGSQAKTEHTAETEMKLFSVLPLYLAILSESGTGGPCPRGWTQFKSYCYLVNSSIKTWDQAQAYCKELGGKLVKINSAEENEFVLNLAKKRAPSLKLFWIGLKWNPSVNDFLWSDHSVPVYKNWAPREPNGNASEPCGHMYRGHIGITGYWNDRPCGVIAGYPCGLVCKKFP